MTHVTWPDDDNVLARVGRHWGWMMAFGIISLLAGVAAIRLRARRGQDIAEGASPVEGAARLF